MPGGIRDAAASRAGAAKAAAAGSVPDRSLTILSRLASEFAAALNLADLLDHVMRVLCEETGFDSCALALVDDRNPDFLVIRAASGIRASLVGLAVPRHLGLHGEVMRTGAALIVPDMHADPRVFRRQERARSGIYAPLAAGRSQIGVLSAHRERPNAFTQSDLDVLTVVARYVTGAYEVALLHEQLKTLAATDALTGLTNRRCFIDRLQAEIARARRGGGSVTVALLDLDRFQAINDAHGRARGDEVLIRVAETLAQGLRASDLAGRFGGDEFVLMLPETTMERAEEVLNRLELRVPLPDESGGPTSLGFSWGTAAYPDDGDRSERLLQVADRRLYEMKRRLYGGRISRATPS